MAEKESPPQKMGRPSTWKQFTDGEWWKLTLGSDCSKEIPNARASASCHARSNGLRLTTRTDRDQPQYLWVRFLPKDADDANDETS